MKFDDPFMAEGGNKSCIGETSSFSQTDELFPGSLFRSRKNEHNNISQTRILRISIG